MGKYVLSVTLVTLYKAAVEPMSQTHVVLATLYLLQALEQGRVGGLGNAVGFTRFGFILDGAERRVGGWLGKSSLVSPFLIATLIFVGQHVKRKFTQGL